MNYFSNWCESAYYP